MASNVYKAELTSKEQVLSYYENNDNARYRVYAGTMPNPNMLRYEYNGADKNEGVLELNNACDFILNNPSNINAYTLQIVKSDALIHAGTSKKSKLLPDSVNIIFQLNFASQLQPYQHQGMGNNMANNNRDLEALLSKLIEGQNLLISRFVAQDAEDEADEIGGIAEPENPLMLLLKNEKIQEAIISKVMGFFENNSKPQAMAGQPNEQDEKIQKAISILKLHDDFLGDDLMRLATMATSSALQFNMVLAELRKL